ncbi:MAG TPA: hypothetical protein VF172_02130 [Nitrososphaera sp.]|jgi:hypothetical protein
MRTTLLAVLASALSAGLAAGIFAFPAVLSASATASDSKIDAFDTIPLEGKSLGSGEFLLLVDSTPALIESGHVALNIPCEVNGDDAESDIAVVAGVAPDLSEVELEYVAELSDPDNDRCVFHVDVPQDDEDVTDVAMINTGDNEITFESGMFVSTSVGTSD